MLSLSLTHKRLQLSPLPELAMGKPYPRQVGQNLRHYVTYCRYGEEPEQGPFGSERPRFRRQASSSLTSGMKDFRVER